LIALYLDEDSEDRELAAALRRAGIKVLTTAEAGNRRLDDPAQLAFAADRGMAIVTANAKDFRPLHAEWLNAERIHAGIIIRFQGITLREEIRRLTLLATTRSPEEMRGAVEFLSGWAR
jgi:hypothetical protein